MSTETTRGGQPSTGEPQNPESGIDETAQVAPNSQGEGDEQTRQQAAKQAEFGGVDAAARGAHAAGATAPAEQQAAPPAGPTAFAAALNTALGDAMAADPSVVVFGEDVGKLGGVFRITDGLQARFGKDRCFDTPLAESGIAGMAVGMAMNGMRPVIEMQFDAFAYPSLEQVFSHIAKMRNRTRGAVKLPITIRIPYAGGVGGVEHHCDSSEGYYSHTPGLKVFTPSGVEDAYTMLREAIASDDPVVFFEPKKMYWSKEEADLGALREQFDDAQRLEGQARVLREGTDATLITYGPSVPTAMKAAKEAAEDGYDLEVLDLRTIVPLDDAAIDASVRKTGRAIVIAESQGFASVASELVARIQERNFTSLASPVLRVTGFDIPFPAPKLEKYQIPSVDRILDTVDELTWED